MKGYTLVNNTEIELTDDDMESIAEDAVDHPDFRPLIRSAAQEATYKAEVEGKSLVYSDWRIVIDDRLDPEDGMTYTLSYPEGFKRLVAVVSLFVPLPV